MCNYTDCYMMYDSQNATSCALGCCQVGGDKRHWLLLSEGSVKCLFKGRKERWMHLKCIFLMCPSAMHQLMRQTDICYVASCVASCAESCVNASQTNCSVNCCNSTGCLNATFVSMMMTTTTGMLLTLTVLSYLSFSHCPWLHVILRVMTACYRRALLVLSLKFFSYCTLFLTWF